VSDELVSTDVELDPEVQDFLERVTAWYGTPPTEEAVRGLFTEDVVYADHRPLVAGTVRGPEALAAWVRTTLEMLPDFRISVHVLAAAGTLYLARDTYLGHAELGGGAAEMQWWVVDELRHGRLEREDIYETEAAARAEYERRAG
jgi:hypothetical protein